MFSHRAFHMLQHPWPQSEPHMSFLGPRYPSAPVPAFVLNPPMSEESRDRLARPRGRTKAITLSLAQGCWILLFLSSCAGTPASEAGLNQHPTTRASADSPAPERSGRQEQSFSLRLDTARWEADPTTIEMMPAGNTMGNVTRVGGKRKGSWLL